MLVGNEPAGIVSQGLQQVNLLVPTALRNYSSFILGPVITPDTSVPFRQPVDVKHLQASAVTRG